MPLNQIVSEVRSLPLEVCGNGVMFIARVSRFAASYVKPLDIALWKHDRLMMSMPNLIDIKGHKELLLQNEDLLTPTILSASLSNIHYYELPLDEHWPEVVQLVKRKIANYDYQAIRGIYKAARHLGMLGESNDEFWEIIETKLIKENLHRYLTEWQCARLMRALAEVGKGSPELWTALERQVKLFNQYLEPDDIEEVIEASQISNKVTDECLAAIKEAPRFAEVKQLE